jgi:hypothetical protein
MIHPLIGLLAPGQVRTGAPGCFPGLRMPIPRRSLPYGGVRPGRSSPDGGVEESPEFREIGRSSRATRRASSAFSASS